MDDEAKKFEKALFTAIEQFTINMRFPLREIKSKEPYVRFVSMTLALNAVQNLMENIPQFKGAGFHIPFRELLRILYLLKEGVELPEFTILRSPKSETSQTKHFKRRCAEAMELLMAGGCTRLKAAKIVSNYWPKLMLTPSTIADWRDNLIGNSDNPSAIDFKQRTDGLKAMNLSQDAIEQYFKITTADQRGINVKRQPHRVMKEK